MRIKKNICEEWVPDTIFRHGKTIWKLYSDPCYAVYDGEHCYKLTKQQYDMYNKYSNSYLNKQWIKRCMHLLEETDDPAMQSFYHHAIEGFRQRGRIYDV